MNITEDMHVHSTFSDGRSTLYENVEAAITRGLRRFASVDHVRRDTTWLPTYIGEVGRLKKAFRGRLEIEVGVEAKILNELGELDLPPNIDGVDCILAADHQFPLGDRCYNPTEICGFVRAGTITPSALVDALLTSYDRVMRRYRNQNVILAHPFSILPKVGLSESQIADESIRLLARRARETGTRVEISERWRCPSARIAGMLDERGVGIYFSTDSHAAEDIGRYDYVAGVARQLRSARALREGDGRA